QLLPGLLLLGGLGGCMERNGLAVGTAGQTHCPRHGPRSGWPAECGFDVNRLRISAVWGGACPFVPCIVSAGLPAISLEPLSAPARVVFCELFKITVSSRPDCVILIACRCRL